MARLVSAAIALALVIANVVGAYAHTHAHAPSHDACIHHDSSSHHYGSDAGGDPNLVDEDDEPGNRSMDHAACDFMCNGGIAILGTLIIAFPEPEAGVMPAAASPILSLPPASPERPPRSPVPA
jgi:hypothetical protein